MPRRRKPERRRRGSSANRQEALALVARIGFPVVPDLSNASMSLY